MAGRGGEELPYPTHHTPYSAPNHNTSDPAHYLSFRSAPNHMTRARACMIGWIYALFFNK